MTARGCVRLRALLLAACCFVLLPIAHAQGAKQADAGRAISDSDGDHVKERDEWFFRGRVVRGLPSAELRRRAHQAKMRLRAQRAASLARVSSAVSLSVGSWAPLGPVPLPSDASGNGTQDYHQVAGRATSVAIDPADASGNTVYIGGAQGGIWKSTNAANAVANNVTWTPITDDQATLSIGAIAIQPGNSDPAKSVILAATGEANNSGDSYFGQGILRSADGGNTWNLVSTANGGALSFSGLGGTRMAFSTANGQTNTAVAAMAASGEGMVDGGVTGSTKQGLYTSLDAGLSWTYNALSDVGGATDATSATSVVYNDGAQLFFAAVRYHGFYSSPDGVTWTRLANQPGGTVLSAAACPAQSISNGYTCPIYRGEIATVPGRNEMYAWYVSLSFSGDVVDGGIWQSVNGGASWNAISDSGITNCGDSYGCGVQQGTYNLELLAMPNGGVADLYAGAVNIYKCQVSSHNPSCASSPFINLTHVYGCSPIAAPSHVHPDQHALASMILNSGTALLYFANDGGIYRALDGYSGLTTGACSGTNQFDDLNQNLGSMAQFVSFSQDPTNPDTLLGGTQDNGSPATSNATAATPAWSNVLGGDGAYNAIDRLAVSNFYASNPDVPPQGLGIQLCTSGVYCNNSGFNFVVTSSELDGDDGAFYFPYILDPGSATSMLVGTCRIWRGPRTGGTFTALSPNFDTLGSGTCSGSEVNQVSGVAAAGTIDSSGSNTIYATTSGLGPLTGPGYLPAGGRVWVTTNASTGPASFVDVTNNGPQGNINPNQFPISSVAIDPTDASGNTAYVTIMGFTGGPGHVWKTTNAGTSWIDFTGNLPDSPANATIVYSNPPAPSQVFVGTDVGVFASPTSTPNWTELGPAPGTNQGGFLPNVAVTALGIYNRGGLQLVRASTYGRGIWQFNLVFTPDFYFSVENSPLTAFLGQTSSFNGTVTEVNGYTSSVTMSCAGTALPSTCTSSTVTPGDRTRFKVFVAGALGDYSFNVQATGADTKHVTHTIPVVLHVVNFGITTPSPASVNVSRGSTSSPVSFQVTAAGSFSQSVTLSCTTAIVGASCTFTPGATVNPTSGAPVNMTASVVVPAGTAAGTYQVTLQANTSGAPGPLTTSFNVVVIANPDFVLTEPNAFPNVVVGTTGTTGSIAIASQDGFSGTVALNCPATYGAGSCSISPTTVNTYPATATLTINGTSFTPGSYTLSITGTSGSTVHTLAVPFTVVSATPDFVLSEPSAFPEVNSGSTGASGSISVTAQNGFSGTVTLSCPTTYGASSCSISPTSLSVLPATATLTINGTSFTPGAYTVSISGTSGSIVHTVSVPFNVGDYAISGTQTFSGTPGAKVAANLQLASTFSYSGKINLTCDASSLAGAMCTFSPLNSLTVSSGGTTNLTANINIPNDAAPGQYSVGINTQDTTGAPSHRLTISLTIAQDFIVTSSTASQSVTAGQTSGPYALRVLPVGSSFNGAVSLACTAGLPGGAQCNFNPSTPVTPGNSEVDVVMSISTAKASGAGSRLRAGGGLPPAALWLPLLGIVLSGSAWSKGFARRRLLACGFVFFNLLLFSSCAGVSSGGGGGQPPPPVTYHITVTGTSPGTSPDAGQSATVALVVN